MFFNWNTAGDGSVGYFGDPLLAEGYHNQKLGVDGELVHVPLCQRWAIGFLKEKLRTQESWSVVEGCNDKLISILLSIHFYLFISYWCSPS